MATQRKVSNLLALGVLAALTRQPMHPYEIANQLRRTGKERDLNIKWGTFYTVVQNLDKHGFIAATGSERAGGRPERTTYALTDDGRAELRDWLRELVAVPESENPRFGAALSIAGVLPPDEVIDLLRQRLRALDDQNTRDRTELDGAGDLPRLFLVEVEYTLAMRQAEADWVRGLLTELRDGTLSGVAEWRHAHETGQLPDDWTAMLEGGRQADERR